jgi:hypothetical protein
MKSMRASMLVCGLLWGVLGFSTGALSQSRFVPNSQEFWDFSMNWTTNYGPAYRDTVLEHSNFLACTGQFALCFHSGPEPLPCKMSKDGRSANCTCTVHNSTNYVLITAILNREVYAATVDQCKADGSRCPPTDPNANPAPVCGFLDNGELIPGAQVISTYDPDTTSAIKDALPPGVSPLTQCNGPFAGCMTAPCKLTKNGQAQCTCPVFWGNFQLAGPGAVCSLGGDLVPSASYNPSRDPTVP